MTTIIKVLSYHQHHRGHLSFADNCSTLAVCVDSYSQYSLLFVYLIVGQGFSNGARGVNGLLERADGKVRKQFSNSFFGNLFKLYCLDYW